MVLDVRDGMESNYPSFCFSKYILILKSVK